MGVCVPGGDDDALSGAGTRMTAWRATPTSRTPRSRACWTRSRRRSGLFASWNDSYRFTSPVGEFKANPWGLYDMHGNVWQWCSDWYGPYPEEYIKNPKGKEIGNSRVLRGGSWHYGGPRVCRSAARYDLVPALRGQNLGFRVVLRPPTRTP